MDQGKEEPSKSLQGSNSYKKQDMDTTSTDQEEDDQMEQAGTKTTAEFQKMESMPTAAGNKESEGTEATIDIEGLDETEDTEELDGTETEYTEESEQEETVLSPKESSTNNPKGIMKMNVEQAAENINQDEQLLSPKESSTNNPKGMKKKRVREEEEDKEDKEKKSKGDSSYADTCTSKVPTSLDLDDKGESMRSPPGDQGYSSHRKNL